jgi:hypothetical protein
MSVRIVKDDFWMTVSSNESLIRKCFLHIFKRYPDLEEGLESVYADMLVWFCDKDILNKFDHSRTKNGKSEDAAWQHFVFCYIQKFLEGNYYNNVKHKLRNSPDANIDIYHSKSYASLRKPNLALFDEEVDQQMRVKNGSTKKPPRHTRINQASVYPTISDLGSLHSSKGHDFTDEIEASDLYSAVKNNLNNDTEREVFKGCVAGFSQKEIADKINVSASAVSAAIKRIKLRCVKSKVFA